MIRSGRLLLLIASAYFCEVDGNQQVVPSPTFARTTGHEWEQTQYGHSGPRVLAKDSKPGRVKGAIKASKVPQTEVSRVVAYVSTDGTNNSGKSSGHASNDGHNPAGSNDGHNPRARSSSTQNSNDASTKAKSRVSRGAHGAVHGAESVKSRQEGHSQDSSMNVSDDHSSGDSDVNKDSADDKTPQGDDEIYGKGKGKGKGGKGKGKGKEKKKKKKGKHYNRRKKNGSGERTKHHIGENDLVQPPEAHVNHPDRPDTTNKDTKEQPKSQSQDTTTEVEATPFGLALDLGDGVSNPRSTMMAEAVDLTGQYLHAYLNLEYEGKTAMDIEVVPTSTEYRDPFPHMFFEVRGVFSDEAPSTSQLDESIARAFSGANLALYLSILQSLPSSNVFRGTKGARLVTPDIAEEPSRSRIATPRRAGIAAAIGGGTLLLLVTFGWCRLRELQSEGDLAEKPTMFSKFRWGGVETTETFALSEDSTSAEETLERKSFGRMFRSIFSETTRGASRRNHSGADGRSVAQTEVPDDTSLRNDSMSTSLRNDSMSQRNDSMSDEKPGDGTVGAFFLSTRLATNKYSCDPWKGDDEE